MSTFSVASTLQMAAAHHQSGQLAEAETMYRQILAAQPQHPDALHRLGLIAHQTGHPDAAEKLIMQALAGKPNDAIFHADLGDAFRAQPGGMTRAIACYRRAVNIRPDFVVVLNSLGNALAEQKQFPEAVICYEQALALQPDYPEAHNNLGNVLKEQGHYAEAIASLRRAVSLRPDHPYTFNNLGNALTEDGQRDEALTAYNHALACWPDYPDAHCNKGAALSSQGRMEEAIASFRQAVALMPHSPVFHSGLLFTLHLHSGYDAQALYDEHRQWQQQHGRPRRQFFRPHPNVPDSRRRLKIGYVSPDLHGHPVGRMLLPLLQNHDNGNFEITCYADVAKSDAVTDCLRERADRWRETGGLSEEELAEQIRSDGIDILVDLSLHSRNNHLPVFARRPAPVQLTWLAYSSTSGLHAMDYRLTDPYLDPPETEKKIYSEVSIRLPETYWCYPPPQEAPLVSAPPACYAKQITFGCLNNFGKVNAAVIAVWARLLRYVPSAHLLLYAHEGSHRERVRELMTAQGVSGDRVDFAGFMPRSEYYGQYAQIDIALDPFPYGGGTTTCDALWMGVPVVSLVGKTGVGRGGLSILSNIGLPELAAQDEDEYIKTAVELANDLPRLVELRATMRERMQASPLMDAPRFARNVEAAYRTMWKKWCKQHAKGKAKS